MAIPGEALRELRDALGAENVCDDPGVLQSYSYMNSIGSNMVGLWQMRPACVVLPGSGEDIQAVLAVCRKHGLKFKPFSTGWIFNALATSRNCVLMDLRRMNRILEINERDGYVIIEPYVTSGEAQAELMKEGLNCHVCGGGPNCSNLANMTSVQGSGGTGVSTSFNGRNVLGVELITAGGDVLHLGSVGTPNAGWFCGDGPGPSLRGMLRGAFGTFGAHGVFTKGGQKCYPWYPEPYRCGGSPPFFASEEIPNFAVRLVRWDDVDDECDGLYRINESELADYCARTGPGAFEECMSMSNEEYLSMRNSGIFRNSFPTAAWTVSMVASSERDLEYRLGAFEKIMEETDGISVDPADMGRDAYEISVQTAIRACWIFKAGFMPTGGFMCNTPMSYETIDQLWKYATPINIENKELYTGKGAIEDDYLDNVYGQLDEGGHFGHNESAYHSDHWEPKTEALGIIMKGMKDGAANIVPLFYTPQPDNRDEFTRYLLYMKKIQAMLDPDNLADAFLFKGIFETICSLDEVQDLK